MNAMAVVEPLSFHTLRECTTNLRQRENRKKIGEKACYCVVSSCYRGILFVVELKSIHVFMRATRSNADDV